MCRLMVDLNSSQVNLARDFGETFAYLVKAADALLRVTHSCFGYVRDCSLVADDNLPGDKSCLVAILNECLDQSLRFRYQSNSQLKRYEVDMASLINDIRFLYARFSIRSTVSCHLLLHALEYLVKWEPNKKYALGLTGTSAFESTHSKISTIFGNNMPLQADSESYATAILQRLNIFNAKNIDSSVFSPDDDDEQISV